jgi:hypothetical protein
LGAPLAIAAFKTLEITAAGCTAGTTTLTGGVFDRASGAGFAVGLQVINNLETSASESDGRQNQYDATIDEVRVTLEQASGAPIGAERVSPASIIIPTGTTANAVVPVFDNAGGAGLAPGAIRARIHVRGKLADGTAVRSNTGVYAITVCDGCVTAACTSGTLSTCGIVSGGTTGQPDGFKCL